MRFLITATAAILTIAITTTAQAFCGFYVARADTSLFNRASQVVLVRDGDRTVITMANDFQGDVQDFAVVIPVPTFIEREQINVADRALVEHLDAYTAPRLVEYHDPDPCARYDLKRQSMNDASSLPATQELTAAGRSRGVTIEASYTVGEYDILILSAEESSGLISWLNENDYKIPRGAKAVVDSYLKQDMRFFVAKVNLSEQTKLGYSYLRPLQVAYESNKFMLPIRLGTLNANGKQELYVYALTRTGRVETTNYRTIKLPSNNEVPEFVQAEFADFYRSMFLQQTLKEKERAVFLEYAWDMAWCDPCAADPLSADELRRLGVFWTNAAPNGRIAPGQAQNVFVTRLHLRYDRNHFPEDLMFQETGDRQNYQGRYVIRHPFRGATSCDTTQYQAAVKERQDREAQTLANLTGWDIDAIRAKIPYIDGATPRPDKDSWWKRLWQ
ncbi:MAG: DUF2330 domain-containing protein [Gammaproteobacteria bacterium]|nr:DUF2330 domain-containing protein [Gammaproteobacteria bacterium]MDH3373619.1 DUF2330 domain-containing protein [Gammaproteobacteria bacterium]MDH3409306.1 DUF2330 domain-containing protein [Gammaproteobacteria bacterium]MDH3553126.1 DUF2330 domain-containing protein [Gammaproteobacteria bacterium]